MLLRHKHERMSKNHDDKGMLDGGGTELLDDDVSEASTGT